MCQMQAEQQHPFAAQRGGSLHNAVPVHLLANSDHLGYVADPLQPLPKVDGCVHAEDQEHHIRREGRYGTASKRNTLEMFLRQLHIEGEGEVLVCDPPLKLHTDATVVILERVLTLESEIGCFLIRSELGISLPRRGLIPSVHEHLFCSRNILYTNQYV